MQKNDFVRRKSNEEDEDFDYITSIDSDDELQYKLTRKGMIRANTINIFSLKNYHNMKLLPLRQTSMPSATVPKKTTVAVPLTAIAPYSTAVGGKKI